MPDDQPHPDEAAARLEAALERIAAAAARPAPAAAAAAPPPPDTASQEQAAAELDGLIARLRATLHEFSEAENGPDRVDAAAGNGLDEASED